MEQFGAPFGTSPAEPDAELLRLAGVHLAVTDDLPATVTCQPLEPSLGVPPTAKLVLRSGTDDVTVRVQRYSSEPVRIGRLPPNTAAELELPGLG